MSKARIYLYDKQRIIKKIVMLDENGNESKPLPYIINYGFITDSIIFGTENKIEFFIHPMGITVYESSIKELEFINNSNRVYNISCRNEEKYLKPNEKWLCLKRK